KPAYSVTCQCNTDYDGENKHRDKCQSFESISGRCVPGCNCGHARGVATATPSSSTATGNPITSASTFRARNSLLVGGRAFLHCAGPAPRTVYHSTAALLQRLV